MTHVTHKIRLVIAAASAALLAAGTGLAFAGSASAATYTDTSLEASAGFTTSSLSLDTSTTLANGITSVQIGVSGHTGGGLSFSGVTPTVGGAAPAGVTVGAASALPGSSFLVSGLADGQDFTLTVSATPNPTHGIVDRATVRIVKDTSGDVALVFDTATVNVPPDTVYPNVNFHGTSKQTCASDEAIFPAGGTACDFTTTAGDLNLVSGGSTTGTDTSTAFTAWTQANLPAGLTLGSDGVLRPGTAVPDIYTWATVLGAEADGAQGSLSFTLKVQATKAINTGNLGDEVNRFGNGFDVYQQHYKAGAIIAGWTATKLDPATNFVRNQNGAGDWQFEAVNAAGIATGLCVSDPGGGWVDPGGPDGLILTPCNLGNFQRFTVTGVVQPGGFELVDVATGKIVNPNGTGAQLTGGTAPSPWGGSGYTWKDHAQLP